MNVSHSMAEYVKAAENRDSNTYYHEGYMDCGDEDVFYIQIDNTIYMPDELQSEKAFAKWCRQKDRKRPKKQKQLKFP